jgi:hypothetical protein
MGARTFQHELRRQDGLQTLWTLGTAYLKPAHVPSEDA